MQRGWVVSPEYRAAIQAISAFRVEQGVTQRELARRLGKPPSFVNKIEQLERRLDLLEFVAIARALRVESSSLLEAVEGVLPKHITL